MPKTYVNPTPAYTIPEPFVGVAVGFGATTGVATVTVVLGRNFIVVVGPDGAADDELILAVNETDVEELEFELELRGENEGETGFEALEFELELGGTLGFVAVTLKLSDETPESVHNAL